MKANTADRRSGPLGIGPPTKPGEHLGFCEDQDNMSIVWKPAAEAFRRSGNRMSPTWARKGSKRWRYYVSQAALQGDKSKAGSIIRVPAPELEALVTEAVGKLSAQTTPPAGNRHSLLD